MEATFRIQRFDSTTDQRPRYQEYKVSLLEGATILDGLIKIKEEQDGTLSFRRSCRSAICGSCAVRVNKQAVLACKSQVEPSLVDGMLTVDPMGNMRVIKDLVVDMAPFWRELRAVQPWLATKPATPERENIVSREQVEPLFRPAQCILCGACYSDCNVVEVDQEFAGPAALAKGYRFVADVRDDAGDSRLRRMSEDKATWQCSRCYNCVQVCPKHVAPLDCIGLLRGATVETGVSDNRGTRHVEAFLESVKSTGRLNEVSLPLKTSGFDLKSLLAMAPIGLRMIAKGKMPLPIERPIPGADDIRRLIETVEEKK